MDALFTARQFASSTRHLFLILWTKSIEYTYLTCKPLNGLLKLFSSQKENMRFYHRRQFDRYERCLEFIEKHQNEFGPKSLALKLKDQLQGVVDELSKTSASTAKAPRVSNSQKQKANNDLRTILNRIARTANAIEKQDEKFKNTFQLPDKRRKNELADAARKFLKDGAKEKSAFESFDMPDGFLDDLKSKLDAYESAQGASKPAPKAKANPEGDSGIIGKGTEIMESLDTLMDNKYHDNEATLGEWHQASGVEVVKRGSRKKKTGDE